MVQLHRCVWLDRTEGMSQFCREQNQSLVLCNTDRLKTDFIARAGVIWIRRYCRCVMIERILLVGKLRCAAKPFLNMPGMLILVHRSS